MRQARSSYPPRDNLVVVQPAAAMWLVIFLGWNVGSQVFQPN